MILEPWPHRLDPNFFSPNNNNSLIADFKHFFEPAIMLTVSYSIRYIAELCLKTINAVEGAISLGEGFKNIISTAMSDIMAPFRTLL